MKFIKWNAIFFTAAFTPLLNLSAAELTLVDFLAQVKAKNLSVLASQLVVQGTELRENEGKLIFRPSMFVQAQTAVDKKPVANTTTQGDQTDNQYVSLGLIQQFDFGLKGQLSYSLSHTKIHNAGATYVPQSNYNDGIAKLELSQSLWRNAWGRENQSQLVLIDSGSKATKHLEDFKIKSTLASAESVYWSLSQMQKVIKVQMENLQRAKKLSQWNKRRIETGLAENSDFLQAEANYKLREYELKNSQLEKSSLERTFNSLRGVESNSVSESLSFFDGQALKNLIIPVREEMREDTKAALEYKKIARANAELAIQRNKPTLELYGSYALNGRDADRPDAISNSMKTDHTTSAVGIRFNTPLDFGTTDKAIDGYRQEQIAADYTFEKKVFDQEREWNDLVIKFEDAKIKLALVEKIAEAQKIKHRNESDRLNKGRTTTFQVLNFEQDHAQAELLKIQSETNLLNIYAQLKIFNAGGSK